MSGRHVAHAARWDPVQITDLDHHPVLYARTNRPYGEAADPHWIQLLTSAA
jgi:hypothetical protein